MQTKRYPNVTIESPLSPLSVWLPYDPKGEQLKDFLLKFLANYNDSCQPFTWTKGPEKLQRIIEATKQYQAEHPPKRKRRRQRKNNIKR